MHYGILAFWVFLTASAVTGIVADYKKRALALAPLTAAIERGQQLDAQVVERLITPERQDGGLNALYLKVGGIVTVAAGVGVAALSFFVSQVQPLAFYPVLGAGVVGVCVGVGLLLGARMVDQHKERNRAAPER